MSSPTMSSRSPQYRYKSNEDWTARVITEVSSDDGRNWVVIEEECSNLDDSWQPDSPTVVEATRFYDNWERV
jgi:hypothetical protein